MYAIKLTNTSNKQLKKLDKSLVVHCAIFFDTLKVNPFVGKLDDTTYHAHIKYHWVAVWEVDKASKLVTITYIGSRESAPY